MSLGGSGVSIGGVKILRAHVLSEPVRPVDLLHQVVEKQKLDRFDRWTNGKC